MKKRLFNQQSEPRSREAQKTWRLSVKAKIMMALIALMLITQGAWAQGTAGSSYNLWIGGTQVTDANKSSLHIHNNSLGSASGADSVLITNSTVGGSLTFDSDNKVLILKNVNLQREIRSGLDNLTIRFEGTNKINSDSQVDSPPYNVHVNAISTYDPTNVNNPHPSATLTVEKSGDGTLELDGKGNNSAVISFTSVSYGSGCYWTASAPTLGYKANVGYLSFYKESICANVVTITTTPTYPLWIRSLSGGTTGTEVFQQVTDDNKDNITAPSISVPSGKKVTFTPSNNTLTLDETTITSGKVLSALTTLKINLKGKNHIETNDSGSCIRSAITNPLSPLTIEKGYEDAALELKNNAPLYDPNNSVIQGFSPLTYSDFTMSTSATTPTYGEYDYDNTGKKVIGLWDQAATIVNDRGITQATFYIDYGLAVAGTPVTSANAGNVFAGTTNDGKVKFIPDANTTNAGTLKLNGLQITGDITSGLAELTIEISGDNTLHASSTISEDGHIIGTATAGTLTFTKASGATGTSSLVLNAANSYSVIQGFTSVTADNDVYFQYGNPYEYNTTDKKMAWLNGSPVQGFLVTTQPSYPLWICDTHASYQAIDGNVSVGGGDIPFTVSGTTYTLTLNNKNLDYQHIISGLDNLTIELVGTNTMNDSGVDPIIESLNNSATLTFKNSGTGMASLVMSNDASGSSIISGFNSVVAGTGLFWTASGAITYDSTNGLLVGTTPAHNATIGVQSYPLWIGSTQVTSANAGNVRNDGTLSYVHDATNNTGTLTLNGVTLNGGDISTSMSDLTIHVKGNNKISAASNCIRSSATTPGKLTFTKDTGGKLELDNASNGYSVIKGFNELAGVPLETKAPYEIYTNGDYYRLKQLFVAAGDTASIDNVWVYADTTYPIWVDGHQATSVSANNILGDAGSTASFNSNTLTLNVAKIPGAIVSSLTSTLTISVKGNSTVSGGIFQTSNATAGLIVAKDAAATGNVSLLVNPGREAAIRGFSSFTYTDFVPFNSSGTTDLSDGISYDNSKALKYNGTALGAVYLLSKTDLATAGLTFTMASVAYTGAAVVLPTTATMDNGTTQTTLTQTTDYTVTGYKASDKTALTSAPIAAGNYYATIQGNGIYTGTADAAFTIDQADFSKITLTIGAITAQTYTGSEIKPTPTVTFAGTQLVPGTDFDYSYANNTNAALSTATPAPTVTITGKGNYTGEKNVKFTINPVDFSTSTAIDIAAIDNQTYTGSEIKPTPTVTFNGNSLTAGTDFRYDYSNNLNVADKNDNSAPTVTIIGLGGNFLNGSTKSKTFTIEQASLATATINPIDPQTFTGSEIKPTPIVTLNGKTLTAGTDFNYGYANNTNAAKSADTSAPTVTVTGKGNFTGTALTKFTINPLAATPDVVLTIPTSYVYDGTAKTPAVAVSVSGVALTTDDYSVAYTDNINAGRAAAKATVTLKRNYSGSKVETFDINPLTATLSWGNTTFVYNGTAQAPTATVTNLVGTDVCNVTVGGAETAAGSYTATATALSNANYQLPASSTTTFTILDRTATIDFGDRTFKTYYDANETFIVPDGTTAYIVTGVSGNAVTIQKVSYIKAGVPVLLESTPGSTVAKNASETFTGNLLKYAAAATPATEKHYLLYKNEFVRASGTISNKVYLDLTGYSGGARSLVIGDGATAIEGIVIDEEDGDAKWYDMQGRRINKPTKAGLYIKDGQKVVVKTRY